MAGSRDEMRWCPFIEGLWIIRMLPDHAWCTITGTNETKGMGWVWNSGGMKFVVGENMRNLEKNLHKLDFFHEAHMEWPRHELGTPAVGGKHLIACTMEKLHISNLRTMFLRMSSQFFLNFDELLVHFTTYHGQRFNNFSELLVHFTALTMANILTILMNFLFILRLLPRLLYKCETWETEFPDLWHWFLNIFWSI